MWLKALLRVSPWILYAPYVLVVIKLARKNQLPKCSSHISKWFLKSQNSGILISYPIYHLGSPNFLNFCVIFSFGNIADILTEKNLIYFQKLNYIVYASWFKADQMLFISLLKNLLFLSSLPYSGLYFYLLLNLYRTYFVCVNAI
jgi:hypothetical protein